MIAVLGAGASGVGVALLAQQQGQEVFLSDNGAIKEKDKALLAAHAIPFEEGHHDAEHLCRATQVVKSPGIPDSAPIVAQIISRGIPILSEIEFCAPFLSGRTIAITGSNGKTTTTMLIYHILQQAGLSVAMAGNIGTSLAMTLATGAYDWYVLELSSFQLDNCYTFHANIAVIMNITPDHLDRYDMCMQRYVDAKLRIIQNQTPADELIYWADDEHIAIELARRQTGAGIAPPTPSSRPAVAGAPHLQPFSDDDFDRLLLATPLRGAHNRRNVVAAYYAAAAAGVADATIRSALLSFAGVEHRLEYVATINGVEYINDSKATNVDACRVALAAMTRPTVLIIGGTDKGNDYTPLLPIVRRTCRALVFLGADNASLHSAFGTLGLPLADTHTMAACVAACAQMAQSGDSVLLSPCCASFDLFKNMADRGNQFRACVMKTKQRNG